MKILEITELQNLNGGKMSYLEMLELYNGFRDIVRILKRK